MKDVVVLNSAKSVGEYLDGLIEASFKSSLQQRSLKEKEKQAATGTQLPSNNSGSNANGKPSSAQAGGSGQAPASSKTMDDEAEKLRAGAIEPADIVSKLNAIRAGRSFKEEHVSAAMDQYVNSLSKAEKTALLAFLKGIAQIVTGEVPADQATEPDADPAAIKMKKGEPAQKMKHIEPNVIKAQPPKQKAKPGQEDTSGPVPITPKKK